jgi:hypothetical protein
MNTIRFTKADLEAELSKLNEQLQEAKRKHRKSSPIMDKIELITKKIHYMKISHRDYILDPYKSDALKKKEYNKSYYAKKKEAKQEEAN